jgi:hypothetical protein
MCWSKHKKTLSEKEAKAKKTGGVTQVAECSLSPEFKHQNSKNIIIVWHYEFCKITKLKNWAQMLLMSCFIVKCND